MIGRTHRTLWSRLTTVLIGIGAACLPSYADAQDQTLRSVTDLLNALTSRAQTNQNRSAPSAAELSIPLQFASAAGPVDPANRNDPRNLDIAGVKLGMTPMQAEQALRLAGYRDSGIEAMQVSYDTDIRSEWAQALHVPGPALRQVRQSLIWRKGEQEVRVEFLALPDGPVANEIHYAGGSSDISSENFAAQLLVKYGKPVNADPTDLRWCTVKAPECEDPRETTYPLLQAWTENRSMTLVGNDPARAEALAVRRAADIASRKPPETTPAF